MLIFEGFNENQKKALEIDKGPLLIMAGAGSGKTRVLTGKIADLIINKSIYPGNILAITFTNKAANEMKSRVQTLLDSCVDSLWISTFHSMGVRILRRNIDKLGYSSSFSIYDRQDQKNLIKECVSELNLNKDFYSDSEIVSIIGRSKSFGVDTEEFAKTNSASEFGRNVSEIFKLYENKMKKNNALDFDDILIKTLILLKSSKETLDYYSKKFEYIFVDEYQDTNKIQYEIVKLLSKHHNNICVVGDSDQSIYGWRGADINNILDFEKDFSNAKIVFLEQNYRSTQNILDAANSVIKNNKKRKEKNLWSENKDGSKVLYRQYGHSDSEAIETTNEIADFVFQGRSYSDIAVLYRTNAQSRALEEALIKKSIPYVIVGGLKFYDRKEVKDIISYLTLIVNSDDDIAFKRVVNSPKRGIGDSSVEKLTEYCRTGNISLFKSLNFLDEMDFLQSRTKKKLKEFKDLIDILIDRKDKLGLGALFDDIILNTGYIARLKEEDTVESSSRIENIEELRSVIESYSANNPDGTLEDMLNEISLFTDIDKTEEKNNSVHLMTIHSAKGLEFPIVFIVGMEEGLFPNSRSKDSEDDIEEERRLCYVAMTRAMENLIISSASYRMIYGKTSPSVPSRFIEEMGPNLLVDRNANSPYQDMENAYSRKLIINKDFIKENIYNKGYKHDKNNNSEKNRNEISQQLNVGDKVKHKTLGTGMVVMISKENGDYKIVVSFDGKGLKTLLQSYAGLKKMED